MPKVKGFTFFASYYEALSFLNEEGKAKMLVAICEYALNGVEPKFEDNTLKGYWSLMLPTLLKSVVRSIAGQQSEGKPKAKRKQNKNKPETNTNQTENKIDTNESKPESNTSLDKDKDKDMDKDIGVSESEDSVKKEGKPSKKELDLSSIPEELHPIVEDWLAYKKERGESYKPGRGFKAFCTKFMNDCGGNAEIAKAMIEKAMAKNAQGFFPLTDYEIERLKKNKTQVVEEKYQKFYATHTAEEEAEIYGIVASAFAELTEEQKNYWRRERRSDLDKWLAEHDV